MAALRRTMATATATALKRASKVVCIGRNYADHIKELRNATPKQPFYFLKPPSAILLPGEGPVLRPPGVTLHYEVELAVVLGKTLRHLREGEEEAAAMDAIQSFAVAIDMTARNVQDEVKQKGLPWTAAKCFDTFLPLSRPIAKERIPDAHEVELFLDVNGARRQQASTGFMLHRIPRILRHVSSIMTLLPGDIVLTGTPAGVGAVGPRDVMRAGVRVRGEEVEEGRIEVEVQESSSPFAFAET